MNRIKLERLHIKRDELCGKMFDSEPEADYNVISGIQKRGCENGHSVQYVDLSSSRLEATSCQD